MPDILLDSPKKEEEKKESLGNEDDDDFGDFADAAPVSSIQDISRVDCSILGTSKQDIDDIMDNMSKE
jgi:hypothetical protein